MKLRGSWAAAPGPPAKTLIILSEAPAVCKRRRDDLRKMAAGEMTV
ncbi:hypothetical protein [Pseudoramibacter alactolyticus]|nr:hypothetical protein [Pseudoramibacter alactolyticus]